jgi:hypothetical protein
VMSDTFTLLVEVYGNPNYINSAYKKQIRIRQRFDVGSNDKS